MNESQHMDWNPGLSHPELMPSSPSGVRRVGGERWGLLALSGRASWMGPKDLGLAPKSLPYSSG